MVESNFDDVLFEIETEIKEDTEEAFDRMKELMLKSMDLRFETAGESSDSPWLQTSLSAIRARETWPDKDHTGKFTNAQSAYYNKFISKTEHPTLTDTGNLLESIQWDKLKKRKENWMIEMKPNVEYGAKLEVGGTITITDGPHPGSYNLEPRPYMHYSNDDLDNIDDVLDEVIGD